MSKVGVPFEAVAPGVDEGRAKHSLLAEGRSPRDIADALAELKAVRVSSRKSGIVFGADQILDLDGQILDKASTIEELRLHLLKLRDRTHILHSAVVAAEEGRVVWRANRSATLKVRAFSGEWLIRYVENFGTEALSSVGGYNFKSYGAQLFDYVDGDYFTILGLPLLQMLDYLRIRGLILK